jgi:hypothetical protein
MRALALLSWLAASGVLLGSCAAVLTAGQAQATREQLIHQLTAQHIFDADRTVTHVSHVCSLRIAGQWLPVIDLQEAVKGAVTPRGANAILILDPALRLSLRLPYTTERPLFCADNRLYLWGDLQIDGMAGEGNEITFSDGNHVGLRHVEPNDVPAPSGKQPRLQ